MLENSYWQEVLSVCAPGLHDPRDHFCILLLSVLYRNLPCLLQLVPVASAFQFDFTGEPCQEAGGREVREESCKPASGWVCHSLQDSGFLQDSLLWLWESVTPLPFRPGGDNSNSALDTLGYTPLGSIPAFVNKFSSVQSLSYVRLFVTPWTAGFLVLHELPELAQTVSIELVMPSKQLILCCSLLLLPSIFPRISIFSNESVLCIRWPKYWSFSFNLSPSNEYSGLISFRIDWLDLLAVQGTLSRVSSNTTVQKHQFFGAQLSL